MKTPLLTGIAFIITSLASAQITTIYQENFDGTATSLNGAAPDIRPGSETWSSSNLNQDGSVSSASMSSWLPYSFQNDMVYTINLTSNFQYQSTSVTPVYLGFTENNPFITGNILGSTQETYSLLAVYRGGGWGFLPGPNNDTPETGSGGNNALFSTTGDYLMQLVLTTSSTENWTVAGYANGIQLDLDSGTSGMLYTFGSTPSFTGIGMGYHSSSFTAEGFSMTAQSIPEPSELALITGALAIVCVVYRRRRSA